MERKKYTIEQIEQLLNELDFEWVDRYMLVNGVYEYAKLSYFKGNHVHVYVRRNDQCRPVMLKVSNQEFIICTDNAKLNASDSWQDLIYSANVQA